MSSILCTLDLQGFCVSWCVRSTQGSDGGAELRCCHRSSCEASAGLKRTSTWLSRLQTRAADLNQGQVWGNRSFTAGTGSWEKKASASGMNNEGRITFWWGGQTPVCLTGTRIPERSRVVWARGHSAIHLYIYMPLFQWNISVRNCF